MKNHLGTYECKLCLTLHNNEVCFCYDYIFNTLHADFCNNISTNSASKPNQSYFKQRSMIK